MSLLGSDDSYQKIELTEQEQAAWELYCEETANSLDARDFWWELPDLLQELYLERVE